jgi:hypothetical protein
VRALISAHLPDDLRAKSVSDQRMIVEDGRRWHRILAFQVLGL